MNTEEIMKLADAYANAAQGYNMATLNKAREALEAALIAKQGEPCKYCGETTNHDTRYCCPAPEAKARKDARAALEAALIAKQGEQDALLDSTVPPHALYYPLSDYHRAPAEGPLNFTWIDKPHRLLYDLIAAVKFYANPAPSVNAQEESNQCGNGAGCCYRAALFDCKEERISELEAQIEQLQVQLAGCGVAALQNTEKSRSLRAVKGEYGYSESYAEVCRAVDREIDLREQNAQLLEALKQIEELSVCGWSAGIARATIAAVEGKTK